MCTLTQVQACNETSILLDHVSRLGFTVNFEKSSLLSGQQAIFISIAFGYLVMIATRSSQRLEDVVPLISLVWRHMEVSFGLLLQLMGELTAISLMVPLELPFLRPLQICNNDLGLHTMLHQYILV